MKKIFRVGEPHFVRTTHPPYCLCKGFNLVDTENREKMADLLIAYMAGDIKSDDLYYKGFEYINKNDPGLMEIFYKALADRNQICAHYITIIKLDWHYYVQMVTFLLSGRQPRVYHYFNPFRTASQIFRTVLLGVILPVGLFLWICSMWPPFMFLFLLPLVAIVVIPRKLLKSIDRRNNFIADAELPDCWPYESEEEFEADYLKYETKRDIPLQPPSLDGKVSKISGHDLRWVGPRPDE